MRKVIAAAVREYRSTVLTKAFIIGGVVFPLVILAFFIFAGAVNLFASEREPMKGRVAVYDATEGQVVLDALRLAYSPDAVAARAEEQRRMIDQAMEQSPVELTEAQKAQAEAVMSMMGVGAGAEVELEEIPTPDEIDETEARVREGDLMALVSVGPSSLLVPVGEGIGMAPEAVASGAAPEEAAVEDPAAGIFGITHARDMDPRHVSELREQVERAIVDERLRRAGFAPERVRPLITSGTKAETAVVTEEGTQASNTGFTEALPFIFMMLLYVAAVTGGNYLLMGTLEEKGSRVMEVLLSAISPQQLLVGKLVGQGLVGLTILGIYVAVGAFVAGQFQLLQLVPQDKIVWLLLYFIMAYALLGAMMIAVGSAVTEIREAQALYAPITMSLVLPFLLMIPVMENPGSTLARVASFFPPLTPFVMVMRLGQPAYEVPLWELIAATLAGFAGVVVVVWAAAKIFRVGVLMYGKPPSLLTLLKWVRHA